MHRTVRVALALVAVIIISLIVSVVGNGQLIRARLTDYQRAGWLSERDVAVFGGPLKRTTLLWFALFRGPRKFWHTARLVRRVTELAYLGNAMTRGVVDGAGYRHAQDLIHEIDALKGKALTDTAGLRLVERRRGRQLPPPPDGATPGPVITAYPPPQAPGPAGVGGNWPR